VKQTLVQILVVVANIQVTSLKTEVEFGFIDEQLAAVIQPVLNLTSHEYTTLLLQLSSLSREQLLARFQ